ncbi:hypothetical protein L915_01427 [Phytophthora nicotianae]|uniref:Uncharacterized protein n=1 Tax=Phytophthora nicotianae TaxID=4792 RepID=W2HMF5_PHYNI|nr:hypothetical protein L915_01427 [Phytophthora nicotianae]ETL49054.1 hypothetical protein L916_01403 [Phytophthora nicotianae]
MLETECTTQVQYIPPGVTALSQPMDVSTFTFIIILSIVSKLTQQNTV